MMTMLRHFLRIAFEKVEDWHNDRLFAAWRAQRSGRRPV
jgi:hypothetical protein